LRKGESERKLNGLLLPWVNPELPHLVPPPNNQAVLFTFIFFLSFIWCVCPLITRFLLKRHQKEGLSVVPLMLHLILLSEEVSSRIVHWVHHGCQLLGVVDGMTEAPSPTQLIHIGLEFMVSLILSCAPHHYKAIEIIFFEGVPVVMVVPRV